MKKILIVLGLFMVMCGVSLNCYAFDISKSPQKIEVDGVQKEFEVYNIDGNNYFKLRDIAYVLDDTDANFDVDYDEEKKIIIVKTNDWYFSNGTEMIIGEDKSNTAVLSLQKIEINGEIVDLKAYNIGGNNFFKLRDLGKELNFIVDYNQTKDIVIIKSDIIPVGYDFYAWEGKYVNKDDNQKSMIISLNKSDTHRLDITFNYKFSTVTSQVDLDINGNMYHRGKFFESVWKILMKKDNNSIIVEASSTDLKDNINLFSGTYLKK